MSFSGISQTFKFNNYSQANGLPSDRILDIVQDSKGYLWIGTDAGLSRFDGNIFLNFDKINGLSDDFIKKIWIDKDDILYLVHDNQKITRLEPGLLFKIIDSLPNTVFYNDSLNPIKTKISNENEVIIQYEKPLKLTSKNGLNAKKIQTAFIDRENIIWIGTNENGIFSLPLQNFPSYTWKIDENLNYSYRQNSESYLLTYDHHIIKAKFYKGKPIFSKVLTSENRNLKCALFQNGNELYYGTDKGLYLYFSGTNTEYSYKELNGKNISHIEKIGGGNLLIIADKKIYRYLVYNNEMKLLNGFENFEANSIQKIDRNIYVLGNENIYRVSNKNLTSIFKDKSAVKGSNFVHISKSENEKHWLSSSGNGLFLFDLSNDSLVNFNKQRNFPYTSILNTTQDNNTLWITTKNGITNFNLPLNAYQFYGDKYFEKPKFLNFTVPFKNQSYVVTNKGLVKHYDTKIFKPQEPNLSFIKILVSGKKIKIDTVFSVGYNDFPVEFSFQSISFKNKIFYQYKLDEINENWSSATLNTSVQYEKLEPGDYTFRVRTYDPINKIALDELIQKFTVKPPFWKTAAFVYLIIGLLAILIFIFYLIRLWRLKKQKVKLERMVDEKTFVLTAQNQNIEQFSYSLSHDLKNPINNIKGLVEIMEGTKDEEQEEIRKMLMNSAILLEDKIKATLNTIKQMQANKKNVELLKLDTVFENVKRSLLIMIRESNVKFIVDFKVKSIFHNASILESVFYNMISNSIKYGPNDKQTIITINSYRKDDKTVIVFEDNGKGIDLENDMDKLFSIFERIDENDETTGTGIGLYMVKQMIELNGGSIAVESEVTKGTKFFVSLSPMEK